MEYRNMQEVNAGEYLVGLFKGENSEGGKIKYGYVIYGNGKDAEWNEGLPQAADGSESIDLGEWLDFVGGLREVLGPADLLKKGKLKEILEKAADAIENTRKELEKEKKQVKTSKTPDSAACPTCSRKEDSAHIDEVNGPGAFKKLKDAKQTGKTQSNGTNTNIH